MCPVVEGAFDGVLDAETIVGGVVIRPMVVAVCGRCEGLPILGVIAVVMEGLLTISDPVDLVHLCFVARCLLVLSFFGHYIFQLMLGDDEICVQKGDCFSQLPDFCALLAFSSSSLQLCLLVWLGGS